ncbi:MAG: hypothetical protein Q8K72_01390, partial [Acidimicrobiales bacterium]|nr:hypothetical protein [Acidimicrobiales bacterium]
PLAEEHIRAVNEVLKDLDCADKPTILVLNKIDRVTDRTNLDVLRAHHPKAIAISGLTGEGLDELREAVVEGLSSHFVPVEVTLDAGNGKALAYLNAHAEIFRQEFRGDEVLVRCYIAKALLHHITGPNSTVRFLDTPTETAKAG